MIYLCMIIGLTLTGSGWRSSRTADAAEVQEKKPQAAGLICLRPSYRQGEVTSQNLWPRYDRHFVGITWHNVTS